MYSVILLFAMELYSGKCIWYLRHLTEQSPLSNFHMRNKWLGRPQYLCKVCGQCHIGCSCVSIWFTIQLYITLALQWQLVLLSHASTNLLSSGPCRPSCGTFVRVGSVNYIGFAWGVKHVGSVDDRQAVICSVLVGHQVLDIEPESFVTDNQCYALSW